MSAPFGTLFAPQMALTRFADGAWASPELRATEPLSLHPGAHVLHYSSTCFEGLKAYKWDNGSAHIFRLDQHVERMQASARTLCLPVPDVDLLAGMIRSAVDAARDEIPPPPGALYVRPTLLGTVNNIGAAAKASDEALLYVITSPVRDYFEGGGSSLRILIEDTMMRTAPHLGSTKTGGNYAAVVGLMIKARQEHRVDQILFCPGNDVQETGAANFLLLSDDEVLTKGLDSTILHGVTRASVLQLAADLGYRVSERDITVEEVLEWSRRAEAALSGTAVVMTSVGTFVYRGKEYPVGEGMNGRNTARLRDALRAIHAGQAEDRHGWLTSV